MAEIDTRSIVKQLVNYVLIGPGAGALAYKTMQSLDIVFDELAAYIAEKVPVFGPKSVKRLMAYALSFCYAYGVYVIALIFGLQSPPESIQDMLSVVVMLVGLSGLSSGTIHAQQQLDKEVKYDRECKEN